MSAAVHHIWYQISTGIETCARKIVEHYGFHLLRNHYYMPIPHRRDLSEEFWKSGTDLVGLEMNDRKGLEILEKVLPRYLEEFRACYPNEPTGDPRQFYLINGNYMAIDAHVYYAFVRHFKPKRIVEIGAGNSTLLSASAGMRNSKDDGNGPKLTAIDPFPRAFLKEGIAGLSEIIESKVQDVGLDLFLSLEAGDILFIDSSHALREGGDVPRIYLEILPRLAPGVLVHVHDISLPKPYPRAYFDNRIYWNEQYLLQAFLMFNNRFEILWPGNYLMTKYPERMRAVFPEYKTMCESYPESEPTAFWMRVR